MKGIAGASRGRLRSGFLRRAGTAFPNASRTIRRCTPSFLATPKTVPTPNSYSRRISSNSSTLALQSTATSAPGSRPQQSSRSFPRWAKSHDQSGPIQSIEIRNLTIERQLQADMVLQVSYVGTRGTHLREDVDLNPQGVGVGTDASRPYQPFSDILENQNNGM